MAKEEDSGSDWLGSALKGAGAGAAGYGAGKGLDYALKAGAEGAKKASNTARKGVSIGRRALRKMLQGTSLGKAASIGGLAAGGLAALRGGMGEDE